MREGFAVRFRESAVVTDEAYPLAYNDHREIGLNLGESWWVFVLSREHFPIRTPFYESLLETPFSDVTALEAIESL